MLQKTKNTLEITEAELNKEKNINGNMNRELSNCISMHEKEVSMRLNFESKLNNLSSMYRVLESRFLIVSKEFVINAERLTEFYKEVVVCKLENKNLSQQNVEFITINRQLVERNNLKDDYILTKDKVIEEQIEKISELDQKNKQLVQYNNIQDSKIRGLESQISK